MSVHILLLAGGVFLVLSLCAGLILLRELQRERRFAERVAMVHGEYRSAAEPVASRSMREMMMQAVTAFGQLVLRSGLLPARTLSGLEQTLVSCGLHGPNGLGLFVGAKVLLIVGLPVAATLAFDGTALSRHLGLALPAAAAAIGLLLPDWLVGKRHKHTLAQLEQGLPDALDMMVICAQAGLGLAPAIIRVGNELVYARPEIAHELLLTANDMQVISDSRLALTNLGTRTGLDSFKRLTTALIQTLVYGTPLTEALRLLSAELRQEVLTRFEARAARLPVLLTLPTVVFILPCVFMIVGGPAAIQIVGVLKGM